MSLVQKFTILSAFLAISANAFYFEDVQNVYIEASDGKAYDFYVNGSHEGSGKRIHYKTYKDNFCKIEVVAKIGDRIYGIEEIGAGYTRESRGFAGNLFHDLVFDSDSEKGCPENVVVNINPSAFLHFLKPSIVNNTLWNAPVKNKKFLIPKKTPSYKSWNTSPFDEELYDK